MYFPNYDKQNNSFCRLKLVVARSDTQLNKQSKLIKSPKLLSQQIRKRNDKTLGTTVINSPLSPFSLPQNTSIIFFCIYTRMTTSLKESYQPKYKIKCLYSSEIS